MLGELIWTDSASQYLQGLGGLPHIEWCFQKSSNSLGWEFYFCRKRTFKLSFKGADWLIWSFALSVPFGWIHFYWFDWVDSYIQMKIEEEVWLL